MPKLHSNDWLRANVLKTPHDSEVLLDSLRFGARMTDVDRQAVWLLLSDTCKSRAKRHYKQSQSTGHYTPNRSRNWYELPRPNDFYANRGFTSHTNRMLILLEFLVANPAKSSAWCIVAWKRRFAQFEELMYMRSLGIHVPIERVQSKEIRHAVFFRRLIRNVRHTTIDASGCYNQVHDAWVAAVHAKGGVVTPQKEQNFRQRWEQYDTLMHQTKYARRLHETMS